MLDAPTAYQINSGISHLDQNPNTFISLPCETFLLACKTEEDLKSECGDEDTCLYVKSFHKQNPMYQSAQVQLTHTREGSESDQAMRKWKGAIFSNDDDAMSVISNRTEASEASNYQRISIPNVQKDLDLNELGIDSETNMVKHIFVLITDHLNLNFEKYF